MLNIDLAVTYKDGTASDIVCKTSDYIAFESHFDKPIAVLEQGRLTHLLWLAWHSAKRNTQTDAEFDQWVDTVDGIESKDSQESIPPLESPQLTG
jgi:hypothetical protein